MTEKRTPHFLKQNDIPTVETSRNSLTAETQFSKDKTYKNMPMVVIAGRPNVGKSTLFNRLMRRKIAITDPTPGVTRDPVSAQASINGIPMLLVDTGGYKREPAVTQQEAVLDELVVQRSRAFFGKADVIILVLEAGLLTGEDEELITELRPYSDRIVLAVNKTEGGRNLADAWNYARFGFAPPIFISAEHGDNMQMLMDAVAVRVDVSRIEEDVSALSIRIAIMGQPNKGKSTLSNRLTHSDASIVSDYAGTTRDVVEGEFVYKQRLFKVLDTAGIRRKSKVQENVEYYSVNRAIKTLDACDIVFLLIDVRDGLTEQDKKICALASERGRGIIFVLNKWDTQEDKSKKAFRSIMEHIRIMFGHMHYAPIVAISALEGTGIIDLLNTALTVAEQLSRKLDTAIVNAALQDWLVQYPPPASKALHFKIRYMTQTGINPVSFLIFATKPESVPESYIAYLKNRIRSDLGYDKIPVQLELRASRINWENRRQDN